MTTEGIYPANVGCREVKRHGRRFAAPRPRCHFRPMMRPPRPVLCLLAFLAAAPSAAAQDAAVEALLRRHHEQRVAHVLGDARMLTEPFLPGLLEIGRGRVDSPSADAARARFDAYLSSVRFLEWEDVRPPRIRISPGGDWAEMIVEKRVRLIPADTLGPGGGGHSLFAWVERWERTAEGWQLATIASTERSARDTASTALAARVRAYEILRRAREAMGGEAAVARVATLRFAADCVGPGGPFVTEVASARDGRVSFVQRFPTRPDFGAGVSLDGPWQRSGDGRVDSLGAVLGSVVTAHEMHLLAIGPESRYTAPRALSPRVLDGRDVHVVELSDALGAPVTFFYDAGTGLPAAFSPANHTGRGADSILTRFDGWRRVGDLLLPFAMDIEQGEDRYRYRVTEASAGWLPDPAFRPGSGAGGGRGPGGALR